nr:hypothetical protein CFP56_28548 [Quercus suber]
MSSLCLLGVLCRHQPNRFLSHNLTCHGRCRDDCPRRSNGKGACRSGAEKRMYVRSRFLRRQWMDAAQAGLGFARLELEWRSTSRRNRPATSNGRQSRCFQLASLWRSSIALLKRCERTICRAHPIMKFVVIAYCNYGDRKSGVGAFRF